MLTIYVALALLAVPFVTLAVWLAFFEDYKYDDP